MKLFTLSKVLWEVAIRKCTRLPKRERVWSRLCRLVLHTKINSGCGYSNAALNLFQWQLCFAEEMWGEQRIGETTIDASSASMIKENEGEKRKQLSMCGAHFGSVVEKLHDDDEWPLSSAHQINDYRGILYSMAQIAVGRSREFGCGWLRCGVELAFTMHNR